MPPRILVLSASVGAGHLRAAQAVDLALRELAPEAVIRSIDVLEHTNATFRRFYAQAYLDLVNRAPHVLGYFYDLLDRAPSPERKSDRFRLALEKLNLRPLLRFLRDEPWDLVVNTHFLPAGIVASLRSDGTIVTPQFTVTTDFETHRLWVQQPCEHYFAATDEGAANLIHWGVPASDVTVTGIPIDPVFARPKDQAECRARHGLAGDRPVILQLAGGFGVGPVEQLLGAILSVETPLDVVVVAGRNEALKARLDACAVPPQHRLHALGFTTAMDELLAAADLVVTKPGGLTTSETLARGAAMAVVNPIPGQESRNSDYLLENGAAIKVNNLTTFARKLAALLSDGPRLARLRAKAKELGRPRAAYDVAQAALQWASR